MLTGRPGADRITPAQPQPMPAVAAHDAAVADSAPEAPRPRLFDWMKRSGRPAEATPAPAAPAPQTQPAALREPVLEGAAAAPAAPPIPASMAPRAPAEPAAPAPAEEDLLDIPAFLRRQST